MEVLESGYYYHIYNRGNNSGSICKDSQDYSELLKLLFHYLYPGFDILSYCILKNHYHLLVRVNFEAEQNQKKDDYPNLEVKADFLPYGYQFDDFKPKSGATLLSHLFNSYTKYFNQKYDRTGSLFEGSFKRKRITDEQYLSKIICYIHRNPLHHGLTSSYNEYAHSSHRYFLSSHFPLLSTDIVLGWFGSQENFIEAHRESKSQIPSEYQFNND